MSLRGRSSSSSPSGTCAVLLAVLLLHSSSLGIEARRAASLLRPWSRTFGPDYGDAFLVVRGGAADAEGAAVTTETAADDEEDDDEDISFEDKVQAAMRKFGLAGAEETVDAAEEEEDCAGGVCTTPPSTDATTTTPPTEKIEELAQRLADEHGIDRSVAMAALIATATRPPASKEDADFAYDEDKAREVIRYEQDAVANLVPADSAQVDKLVAEGFHPSFVKRALALTDMNIDDARAVLIGEQEDEEMERQEAEENARKEAEAASATSPAPVTTEIPTPEVEEDVPTMKTVSVDANFDPTKPAAAAPPAVPTTSTKPSQIFSCTTAELQEMVLESPVPVLLDIYADWCGPCKQLTPALEDICRKADGMFRLVKLNADEEKAVVQSALKVTGFPTLFGIREGKIVNRNVGAPQSEEAFRAFMMTLMTGQNDDGKNEAEEFAEMTTRLVKMAGTAALPFSLRERMQTMTQNQLTRSLEVDCGGDMFEAEASVKTVRSLLSKVIGSPSEPKFRQLNLAHPALKKRLNPGTIQILRTAGFVSSGGGGSKGSVALSPEKRVINIAPLMVVRDCLDKWMDTNRYEIAKAARKKKEDEDRENLVLEESEEEEEEEEVVVDPTLCVLKVRIDGKKKVHEMEFHGDDNTVKDIVTRAMASGNIDADEEVQLICAAKRLILKSSDDVSMNKTLREMGMYPSASCVVKVMSSSNVADADAIKGSSGIADRAKAKKKKTGSHTMQSIGIYAKDDNNKAELIDGGGGVMYEHDVSSDDEEEDTATVEEKDDSSNSNSDAEKEEDNGDDAEQKADTEKSD